MKLELFPCSGGMAEGFRRAGIRFDLAVDIDEDACDSYEKKLGHRPVRMDVNDFVRMVRAGWRPPGGVDLLVADPPCTPWSRAGNREGLEDERDCLRVTAELVKLLRPRAYLIGNVPGLQDATQWHVVQDVIGGLTADGYCVRDYTQLDAADYGVPQHRVRPFWFGHLDGPCVRWPERTHGDPDHAAHPVLPGTNQLLPWVTCRAALGHLPLEDLGRPVRMRIRQKGEDGTRHGGDRSRCSKTDAPARVVVSRRYRKGGQILIPGVPEDDQPTTASSAPNGGGGGILNANDKHPASTLDAPAFAVCGSRASRGAQGGRALFIGDERDRHPASELDKPGNVVPASRPTNGGALLAIGTALEHPRHPISRMDAPAFVVKANGGRAAGNGTMLRLEDPNRPPASLDEPHRTIGTTEDQAIIELPERLVSDSQGGRVADVDEPSPTITAAARGTQAIVGQPRRGQRIGGPDRPGDVVTSDPARVGAGPGQVLEWPWHRPSTVVTATKRLAPPGHHPESGSVLSQPNAVVLSEKAAAILQGFPDHWTFSGKTKETRWGQIGMAMPPGLAEAVACAVREQLESRR